MKFVAILLVLFSAILSSAQEEQSGMIKTANGVLVVWNEPGNYYTIEFKGKDVRPAQPRMFQVDGIFFQVQTAAKKEFLKDPSDKKLDDRAILTAHRDWERAYVSDLLKSELKVESEFVELPNGTLLLGWSFDMPKVADDQTAKRQLFLTVVKRDHVFVLNSALTDIGDARDAKEVMIKAMMTLKTSDKPLPLKKAAEEIKKGTR